MRAQFTSYQHLIHIRKELRSGSQRLSWGRQQLTTKCGSCHCEQEDLPQRHKLASETSVMLASLWSTLPLQYPLLSWIPQHGVQLVFSVPSLQVDVLAGFFKLRGLHHTHRNEGGPKLE